MTPSEPPDEPATPDDPTDHTCTHDRARLRVALATCADHPGFIAGGNQALIPQLAQLAIDAELAVWTDSAIDWASYDAVLIRTTWDYTQRLDEFIAWMRHVESATRLFNSSAIAEPNLDKRYLQRLGDAAMPTIWLERGADVAAIDGVIDQARRLGWRDVVLKPTVAAAAEGLLITTIDDRERLHTHAAGITSRCGGMLQPLIESVRTRGELSIVYVEGEATHAVRKVATNGDYRCQIEFGGTYVVETPTAAARRIGERARVLWDGEPPLYARVDLLEPEANVYRIIEVELVEPELFFRWAPTAAATMGRALRRRLGAADAASTRA